MIIVKISKRRTADLWVATVKYILGEKFPEIKSASNILDTQQIPVKRDSNTSTQSIH